MDSNLKKEWLSALRSGDYKQGTKVLRKGNSFCCLGVLCDVVDPSRWNERDDRYLWGKNLLCFAPSFLVGWGEQNPLVRMNDAGFSFLDIADWIEENL